MIIWFPAEEQSGLQTRTEAKPSAWMKHQHKAIAVGCGFERGRGSTRSKVATRLLWIPGTFLLLLRTLEEQDHTSSHPSLIVS